MLSTPVLTSNNTVSQEVTRSFEWMVYCKQITRCVCEVPGKILLRDLKGKEAMRL